MLEDRRIWVEGALRPWAEATVHVMSQSLQRGTLVFDFMPIYATALGPRVFGLREHVERFARSAALDEMPLRWDVPRLVAAVRETVRANPGSEVIKISGYFAAPSLDVLPTEEFGTVAIAALAKRDLHPDYVDRSVEPARLQIAAPPKLPPSVLSPQMKIAASYTHAVSAKRAALRAGCHDLLFLDQRGNLAESSTASFFLVVDGAICSAPLDTVLDGVTRRAAIELARAEGIPVRETVLPPEWLGRAQEAFLTGSSVEIWPIGRIGDTRLPAPVPGPITARLRARYERMVKGQDPELSPRWMQEV
jgi:branched-chain amino acid aminotransferase